MEKRRNKISQTILMLTGLLLANVTLGGTPITISFEHIEFNSGYILTLGDGTSNNTDLSEYFAFYLSSNRNSYVDLSISSNCSDPVTLIINAKQSGSGLGNMCKVLYNYTISSGTPIELNFDGAVPATISKYDYYWNWTITAIPCNTSAYDANTVTQTTHHCCYVLYDEPQTPMDEPWIDVLDYACSWAAGLTVSSDIIETFTEQVFTIRDLDGDVDYDWPNGPSHFSYGYDKREFDLYSFLYELKHRADVKVNCSDVANILCLVANTTGLLCYTKRILKNAPNLFQTNQIDPIGSPGWNTAFWAYHHFGWYNNLVYDACVRVNNNNPFIPKSMTQSSYDNYLLFSGQSYDSSDIGSTTLF